MNPLKRLHTRIAIALLSVCASCAGNIQEPTSAAQPTETLTTAVPATETEQAPVVEPAPDPATADVLKLEKIAFAPDASPLPETQTFMDAAVQGDAAAQFILQMMYRDRVGDVIYWDEQNKKSDALSNQALHREMIRWRDISVESSSEIALLSAEPSIIYETSPLFSADDTFKTEIGWLDEAAKRGFGNAEFLLGLIYWNGIGVDINQAKGYELLVRAAAHGVGNASYAIAMIHELNLLSDPDISRDTANKSKEEKVLFWLRKAWLSQNNEDARFILTMKYADHIGIPDDKDQADGTREAPRVFSESGTYHLWTLLHDYRENRFENMICKFEYDKGEIGNLYYYSECGDEKVEIDEEDEVVYSVEDAAEKSLDYKIDYKLAGKWLRANASDLSNINVRILRTQTRAITGCRGNLNGEKPIHDKVIDRIKNYEIKEGTIPDNILNTIIATELDEPAMTADQVFEWYKTKAEKGDENALSFLGDLYNVNPDDEEDDDPYLYYCKLWNIQYDRDKAYDYYSLGNQYYQAESVAQNSLYKAEIDNDAQAHLLWKKRLNEIREQNYIHKMSIGEYHQAGNTAKDIRKDAIRDKNDDRAYEWALKYIDSHEKQYEAAFKKLEKDYSREYVYNFARNQAQLVADMARDIGDEEKAIEWYNKALAAENARGDEASFWMKSEFYYALGILYDSGSEKVNNKSMALDYYKKLLVKKDGYLWTHLLAGQNRVTTIADVAVRIGQIFEEGTDSIAPDKDFALEWYKRANEVCAIPDPRTDAQCKANVAKRLIPIQERIESLPKIDLLDEVEKQIKAEHGKKPEGFFVIKDVLNPCLKRLPRHYYHSDLEKTCTEIPTLYDESIQKAMTAIVALNLAGGSYDENIVANTFYYLAVYKGNNSDYRKTLKTYSPVYAKLTKGFKYDDYDKEMFDIWYLRQIPYAAEEKYKTMNTPESWQHYMDKAKSLMAENEQLRKAFNFGYTTRYDAPEYMQRFRDENRHPEWFGEM